MWPLAKNIGQHARSDCMRRPYVQWTELEAAALRQDGRCRGNRQLSPPPDPQHDNTPAGGGIIIYCR